MHYVVELHVGDGFIMLFIQQISGLLIPLCMKNPHFMKKEKPCSVILSDEELLDYLYSIEKKTYVYLDSLTDDMLYEKPEQCRYTRMELVLRQFRHLSFHTGMLNGQTALSTGQFPMWVSEAEKYVDDGVFFGRYRKGKVRL